MAVYILYHTLVSITDQPSVRNLQFINAIYGQTTELPYTMLVLLASVSFRKIVREAYNICHLPTTAQNLKKQRDP
jgi:hypothetical protein